MNTSSLNVILKQLAINNGLRKELEDLIARSNAKLSIYYLLSSVNIHVSPPVNRNTSIIRLLKYLASQSFDYDHTWQRLFKKLVVRSD
jgi:DNA-binding NtrC family response regulator